MAEQYQNLEMLDLNGNTGLTGTFEVPKFLSMRDSWSGGYVPQQLVLDGSGIETIDVSNAGNLRKLNAGNCPNLSRITGTDQISNLTSLIVTNAPSLHYLDLPNLKKHGRHNSLLVSGTDLAYVNIPDEIDEMTYTQDGFNSSNLKTQSIDVEIGGYDETRGYWADLEKAFPGIIMERIANLQNYTAKAGSGTYEIDGGKIYGIKPDEYVTYTYNANNVKNGDGSYKFTLQPIIHFVSITLEDGGQNVPVGDTGVEVTLPGGSVAKPDGSFTTPGDLTVNPDGTITTENGTNLTIPGTGAVVTEDGKVTLPQGDVTYVDSDKTLTVPDGAVVNPDGTITWPKGDIAVNPDGSVTIGNGDTVKPDGDVQIDGEGNILLPDGGSIIKPDGTEKPVAPGTTVFPDGTTDEKETPTDPGEGDPTNPGEQPTDPDNGQNPSEPTPDQGNTGNGGSQNTGSTQTGTQTTTPGGEGKATDNAGGINGQSTGNAQTGDSSQVTLWAGLLSVSAMVLGFLGFKRKKQNS